MDAMRLGKNIRHLRLRSGLSQAALGNAAGIRGETVHHIEKGRDTSVAVAERIAKALGVRVVDLLGPDLSGGSSAPRP